jgi:hypothetical protein
MAHQQPLGGGVPLQGPVAGGAPHAVPPVAAPVHAAPQLPFAADPGTITGWLLAEAASSTADTLSDEIEAVTLRYQGYAGLPVVVIIKSELSLVCLA